MFATKVEKVLLQRKVGTHNCGADYGWCGEHTEFVVKFICPECQGTTNASLCSAWPISETDCSICGARIEVQLDQKRTRVALR